MDTCINCDETTVEDKNGEEIAAVKYPPDKGKWDCLNCGYRGDIDEDEEGIQTLKQPGHNANKKFLQDLINAGFEPPQGNPNA